MPIGPEQVIVALPHTIHDRDLPVFDLVIFDEAHQLSEAGMASTIMRKCGMSKRLDLTATPSPFVRKGIPVVVFSMLDALYEGIISDPLIELATSRYGLSEADYTDSGNVRDDSTFKFSKVETRAAMDRIENKLLNMITRRLRGLSAGSAEAGSISGGRMPNDIDHQADRETDHEAPATQASSNRLQRVC